MSNRYSDLQKEAKALTAQLINLSNAMGSEDPISDGIAEALQSEHRTLQQGFVKIIVVALVRYSDAPFDLRNEAAVDAAKQIKELELHFPFI